ncbi:hypothetical protein RW092_03830 [Paenibacillus sp. 3LSP]|uniref:hypothetical protein n=1 Tax=Paenibacillus sp. 3LSP TaxID=2800795 RepID=UPI0028FD6AD0|nr:hypothetical protein [Paenibacillus sp. 3LSP]MDU0329329.1 hypothetical protein [Paenibacillus sp. 3LSP]
MRELRDGFQGSGSAEAEGWSRFGCEQDPMEEPCDGEPIGANHGASSRSGDQESVGTDSHPVGLGFCLTF